MSDYADRALSKQEIRQMKEDWRRTDHNLTQVAELHACTRADVVAVLGLTEADLKPLQRKKIPRLGDAEPRKGRRVRPPAGRRRKDGRCLQGCWH